MRIETLEKIRIPAGVRLRLTEAQLDARRHSVLPIDGIALVLTPMDFKQGEIIDVDGSLPISIPAAQYQVLDDIKAKKNRKRKILNADAELVDGDDVDIDDEAKSESNDESIAAGTDNGLADIDEDATHV